MSGRDSNWHKGANGRCSRSVQAFRKPNPRAHKARLVGWTLFWPWSLLWTVCLIPVYYIVRSVCREVASTFQQICEHEFDGIEQDWSVAVPPEETATPATEPPSWQRRLRNADTQWLPSYGTRRHDDKTGELLTDKLSVWNR